MAREASQSPGSYPRSRYPGDEHELPQREGMGNAGRTLGIIAAVAAVLGIIMAPLLLISLVLGILAIIFSFVGRRRIRAGEASNVSAVKTGLITGIVGTAISLILIAVSAVFVIQHGDEYQRCLDAGHDAKYCRTHYSDTEFQK